MTIATIVVTYSCIGYNSFHNLVNNSELSDVAITKEDLLQPHLALELLAA